MRNIDIKMKLKLIVGLIGVLSLSSFSTLPSSDDTDKKEQENWVIGPFHRPEGCQSCTHSTAYLFLLSDAQGTGEVGGK